MKRRRLWLLSFIRNRPTAVGMKNFVRSLRTSPMFSQIGRKCSTSDLVGVISDFNVRARSDVVGVDERHGAMLGIVSVIRCLMDRSVEEVENWEPLMRVC